MFAALLALALVAQEPRQGSPEDVAIGMRQVASAKYAEREAGSSRLERCCWQDPANLELVAGGLESRDAEVRWRCWRVIRTIKPCLLCGGRGRAAKAMGVFDDNRICDNCRGDGASWNPKGKHER